MLESQPFDRRLGESPVVISLPNGGLDVPGPIAARMTRAGLTCRDAAWHIHRLMDGVLGQEVSVVQARYSRYLADMTGDPEYDKQSARPPGLGICPTLSRDGQPLYRTDQAPDGAEVALRRVVYWQPYRDALAEALRTACERDGAAFLLEIDSQPSGRMAGPVELSTAGGAACSPVIRRALEAGLADLVRYDYRVDQGERTSQALFQHGRPFAGTHAAGITLAQNLYMQEQPPFALDEAAVHRMSRMLASLVQRVTTAVRKVARFG